MIESGSLHGVSGRAHPSRSAHIIESLLNLDNVSWKHPRALVPARPQWPTCIAPRLASAIPWGRKGPTRGSNQAALEILQKYSIPDRTGEANIPNTSTGSSAAIESER